MIRSNNLINKLENTFDINNKLNIRLQKSKSFTKNKIMI